MKYPLNGLLLLPLCSDLDIEIKSQYILQNKHKDQFSGPNAEDNYTFLYLHSLYDLTIYAYM